MRRIFLPRIVAGVRNFIRSIVIAALLSAVFGSAQAQTAITTISDEYANLVKKGQDVGTLGADLFGDKVAPYTGATEFSVTDVSLPGNSALPVEFRRYFAVEDRWKDGYIGSLGQWDIDVPFMHGTFLADTGWQVQTATPLNRCSVLPTEDGSPPSQPDFANTSFWHGHFIHTPGEGDEELLQPTTSTPAGPTVGGPYRWVTKGLSYFSCKALLNAAGEGFVATAPNGTKTYFDWQVVRDAAAITQPNFEHYIVGAPGVGCVKRGCTNKISQAPPGLQRSTVFLMASRVEDRFGNWVNYTYTGDLLTGISSNDGRTITIAYTNGMVSSVSTGSPASTWSYQYDNAPDGATWLSSVTLPDASQWTYSSSTTDYLAVRLTMNHSYDTPTGFVPATYDDCMFDVLEPDEVLTYTITHPSGAVGTFTFTPTRHQRSYVAKLCNSTIGTPGYFSYPPYFDVFSLTSKQITGVDLNAMQWSYAYDISPPTAFCQWADIANNNAANCPGTKTNTVIDPEGVLTTYTFGNKYQQNEGQMLGEKISKSAVSLQGTDYSYAVDSDIGTTAFPFPDHVGKSPQGRGDKFSSEMLRPQKRRGITLDQVTFSNIVNSFDIYAHPLSVDKSSILASKTEITAYDNNLAKWVLGQVHTVTDAASGLIVSQKDYDAVSALPLRFYSFGKLSESQTYNADGTLNTVSDGLGRTYTFSNYSRGIAQSIGFPDTHFIYATVDNMGHVTTATDQLSNTTTYHYNLMGRLTNIQYPVGDTVAWNDTNVTFAPLTTSVFGLGWGSWKQTVTTGASVKETYFDALWRPVVSNQYDSGNLSGTQRAVVKAYDSAGRITYQSYPQRTVASYLSRPTGTYTTYDGLGRVTQSQAGSELGVLTTTTAYLSGLRKQVTNPRGKVTTMSLFQAFDAPSYDAPTQIAAPESLSINISYDTFGKPTSIVRSGISQVDGSAVSATRSYVYDANRLLCKTIDPEVGATVQDYDAANNIAWTAAGLPLTNTTTCDRSDSSIATVKAPRAYDKLNRLTTIGYADGSPMIQRTYFYDGKVNTVSAGAAAWTYNYNKRRLLTTEDLASSGITYSLKSDYDANGNLKMLTYPDLLQVDYAPNALGEPTQAGSYASAVTTYPNGAIQGFTYGNGVAHTLSQSARGLPQESKDLGVLDDVYAFDANANVASITDQLNSLTTRTMGYDDLDRLATTSAPSLWGAASYKYDALDNLRSSTVATRSYMHAYDATNKLQALMAGSTTITGYAYDPRGNLSQRGNQSFIFDHANRLTSTSGPQASNNESYLYDGNGRRVTVTRASDGSQNAMVYSQNGQLRFEADTRNGSITDYIYLGHSLVAREVSAPPTGPGIPTITAPATNNTGSYTVSWTAVPGTDVTYQLQELTGGNPVSIYSGSGLSFPPQNRTTGSYGYQVNACIGTSCSTYSTVVTVVVTIPAPTIASAGVQTTPLAGAVPTQKVYAYGVTNATSVQFSTWWTGNLGDAQTVQGINSGGGTWYANVDMSLYEPGNPRYGTYTTKAYVANSLYQNGQLAASATASWTRLSPLQPPGNLSAPSPSYTGTYEITWSASTGATQYQLQESVNGGTPVNVYTGAALFFDPPARANNTYTYRVSACDAVQCSAPSTAVTVVVQITPVPAAPTINQPADGGNTTGSYTIGWTSVSGATSYQLDEKANGANWPSQPLYNGNGLSKDVTRPNGTYTYRVRACNVAGCGNNSVTKLVGVNIPSIPTIPLGLTAPASSQTGTYAVTWTASSGSTTSELDESADAGVTWHAVSTSSATVYNANNYPAGSYLYRVKGCNTAGCSAFTASVTVYVDIAPAPPTGLSVPANSSTGNYTVSWAAVAGTGIAYQLDEFLNGVLLTQNVYTGTGLSYSPSGRGNGTYGYQVRACTSVCGANSATQSITVTLGGTLAVPTGLTGPTAALTAPAQYVITWNAVPTATSYTLAETTSCGTVTTNNTIASGTSWSSPIRGVTCAGVQASEVDYSYKVQACIGTNCSAWSSLLHVQVLKRSGGPLSAPSALTDLESAASVQTITYLHTDALGSPIAETDANAHVTKHTRYEPYGAPADGSYTDGPGFTGHVTDASTGMTYMQQRYYDPIAGRFLSLDPVAADANSFNRYWYANNNPYKNVDPDGRDSACFYTDAGCSGGGGASIFSAIENFVNSKAGGEMIANIGVYISIAGNAGGNFEEAMDEEVLAENAAMQARAQSEATKTFQTYTKAPKNPETDSTYSGRTSGTGTPAQNVANRNAGHDMNETHEPAVLDKSSSNPDAIRGREQQLIDANGGAQSKGGTSGNKINGVSPTNPKAENYKQAADEEFKDD